MLTTKRLQQLITYLNETKLKRSERQDLHLFILESIMSDDVIDVQAYFYGRIHTQSNVAEFMEQCSVEGKINATELYRLYELWCGQQEKQPASQTKFGMEVKRLSYPCKHTKNAWVYEIGGKESCK